MTGDTGRGDLEKKIFYLTGNVVGIGEKRQAQLNTDCVTWYLTNQTFDAEGNVVYKQLNPVFNLTGPRAAGELKNQTVIVKGDGGGGKWLRNLYRTSIRELWESRWDCDRDVNERQNL